MKKKLQTIRRIGYHEEPTPQHNPITTQQGNRIKYMYLQTPRHHILALHYLLASSNLVTISQAWDHSTGNPRTAARGAPSAYSAAHIRTQQPHDHALIHTPFDPVSLKLSKTSTTKLLPEFFSPICIKFSMHSPSEASAVRTFTATNRCSVELDWRNCCFRARFMIP